MTEETWLSSSDLRILLDYLYAQRGQFDRRLQALCCGFCRIKQQHLRAPGIPHLLNQMELFVEGRLARDGLRATRDHVRSRSWGYGHDPNDPVSALRYIVLELAAWLQIEPEQVSDPYYSWEHRDELPEGCHDGEQYSYPIQIARMIADAVDSDVERLEGWSYERDQQLYLIHCLFGNPFRPVTLDPRWLSSTVLDLANLIYNERQFERMPLLGDALMDAGCDNEEVIKHCHGPGPHVRGCWVVDLLLSKE